MILDQAKDIALITLRVCTMITCRRYSVEDDKIRYTLDVNLVTDLGKQMPYSILEFKSTDPTTEVPSMILRLNLRCIKLSKFKWATCI